MESRLRSTVSPSKISLTRASTKYNLPPQIPPESAADISVLIESDSVLQQMPLTELFANENCHVNCLLVV